MKQGGSQDTNKTADQGKGQNTDRDMSREINQDTNKTADQNAKQQVPPWKKWLPYMILLGYLLGFLYYTGEVSTQRRQKEAAEREAAERQEAERKAAMEKAAAERETILCIYEGCTVDRTAYINKFCPEHTCVRCEDRMPLEVWGVKMPGSEFCELHKCRLVGCVEEIYYKYRYCYDHAQTLNDTFYAPSDCESGNKCCAIAYCFNDVAEDSNFCPEHICRKCQKGVEPGEEYCGEHIRWAADRSKYLSGKDGKWLEDHSSRELDQPRRSHYKSDDYEFDPEDYDSPEDFADDAWGHDFEDWDDAYDAWEDY